MKNVFNKENLSVDEKELILDALLYYKKILLSEYFKNEIKNRKAYERFQVKFLNELINELKKESDL